MQSSLKKSLYLGLAALTFASVAGASVSATSTNANAAKHTTKKVAKKVTYKTTDSKLDQSVVYVSTGKNAVYSKPGTVKGAKVVASKSTMASLANTKSVSAQFMAYQEATTSKGVKYLKVVSFDKKIRGYVYVGGVQQAQGTASAKASYNFNSTEAKNLFLKTPRVFDKAYGSSFGAKLIKLDSNFNVKTTSFTADDAVTNANGDTYFHVTANGVAGGLTGTANQGWVNAKNLTTDPSQAFSDMNITVNFVDTASNTVIDSKTATPNAANGGVYNTTINGSTTVNAWTSDKVSDAVAAAKSTDAKLNSYNLASNYNNTYNVVSKGAAINVYVTKSTDYIASPVKVNFITEGDKNADNSVSATAQQDLANVLMSDGKTAASSYTFDNVAAGLKGIKTDNFSFNNVVKALFADGKAFNTIVVKSTAKDSSNNDVTVYTTYKFDAAATQQHNNSVVNQYTGVDVVVPFQNVSAVNVYYTKVASNTTTPVVPSATATTNSNVTNITSDPVSGK